MPILKKTLLMLLALGACRDQPVVEHLGARGGALEGPVLEVRDTTIVAMLDAAGSAQPVLGATLSTKLAGAVSTVEVNEGDMVRTGQVLLRIDARDVAARRVQVEAAITEAEAVAREAATQARRFRSLYADSAATRAQLDAAETGLARADAQVRSAQAGADEVRALEDYAVVRAPFSGMVIQRTVDPGDFAAPGVPLLTLADGRRLRISATVAPAIARRLVPGSRIDALIEGIPVVAIVEGAVPAPTGAVYTVNAMVDNPAGRFSPGGAAVLRVPLGTRSTILLPQTTLVREGDLIGVRLVTASGVDLRWVRAGRSVDGMVEILAGLRAGDRVLSAGGQEENR